jgi:hypothetical protein
MELVLNRDYRDDRCTIGTIEAFGRRLQTMERPWVPSAKSVAPGKYKLERHSSEAHKDVWALVNKMLDVYHFESEVPPDRRGSARTVVLIHSANWASELRGCIAPGKERVSPRAPGSNGSWMVARSRDAMNELRNIVAGKIDVWLTITEDRLK